MDTLREKIGQFFMIRFAGSEVPPAAARFIAEGRVGGVVLFASNCPSLHRTYELIHHLKSLAKGMPLTVAIDHEGGRVCRLPEPVTHFPPLRQLGRLYERLPSSGLALEVGRVMGKELKTLGIDLNFAPVADVDTNPFNPVIGDRSPSKDAEVVAIVVSQLIRGLQEEGVASCAKHFPGHGDTNEDSHEVLPELPHNLRRLNSLELLPFRAAIQQKVSAIMPAHVVYQGVDKETPATTSVKILRDILRTELGFEGLIVSDDLAMGAMAKHWPLAESCCRAFNAGCDLLLTLCPLDQIETLLDSFTKAVAEQKIPASRLEASFQRIARFKERFVSLAGVTRPNFKAVGSKEHRYLLSKINELA